MVVAFVCREEEKPWGSQVALCSQVSSDGQWRRERWARAADMKYSFTWQQPSRLRDEAVGNSVIAAIPNMLTLALLS